MEGRPEFHVDELYSAVKAKQLSLGIPSTSSSIDLTNTLRERGLIPELRPYQLDALNWMLSREQNSNSTENGIGKHVLGGILADEMGLGKTVEVLALILANPHPSTVAQLNTPSLATNQDISNLLNGRKSSKNSKTKKTLATFGVKTNANELPSIETEILPSAQVLEQKVPNDPPKQARKRVRPTGCEVLRNTCNKCGKLKADSSSPPKRGRTTTNLDKTIEEVIQSNTASDQYCRCTSKVSETRQRAQKLYTDALAPFQSSNYASKSKSSTLTKERTNTIQTRCTCGGVNAPPEAPIECTDCHTWQHPSCVNIDVSEISGSPYFCSLCTCKRDPVISGTTLIITPSTISYQWISEIRRHVSSLCKILVYKGVKAHGYIRPCDLARFDVIITTYQVLRSELHFADVALNEPPRLRRASTFMNTPSPLVSINWWRICLDEAQMVEGTSTQAAKMALRLTTELRWCVTGTPVQKSTADLFGLFTFLQLEPYDQFRVFRNEFLTGQNEERLDALAQVLAHVMWRSSKKDVIHQIRLPEQSQKTHWLKFSPIEDHFYKQQHAACTRDALARFSSFGRLNLRLSDIDRETVTKLLNPLLRLRQACCHPQMVKGQFVSLNRAALTMEQLLEALIKKAFVDCEDTHRLWVAAVNGMAAVYILKEKFPDAVELYRTVLRKNEELKGTVKTDTLQLLHATYNLAQVLDIKEASIPPTLRDSKLNEEVDQLKDHYLNPFAANIVKAEEKLNPIVSKVTEFEEQLRTFGEPWWTALLTRVQGTSLDARCVQEVQEKLAEGDGQDRLERVHNRFSSISGLMYLLSSRLDEITENREEVTKAIKELKTCTLDVLATEASYCHLRPEASRLHKKCPLCVAHDQIEDYETLLFHMAGRKEVDDKEGANALMDELRKGTWADGETERILKCLLWFARRIDCPPNMVEGGSVHLKLFDTLKREFRLVRVFWRRLSDQAAAVDELNMAKLRLRVRLPGEKKPNKDLSNADKRVASELETGFKETYENIYIIEPHEVSTHLAKLKLDATVASHEFDRKKGRLLYLQNLEKAGYGKKGSSNPEECPICKLTLGNKWSVLQCGHSFCMDCVQRLAMGGVAKKLNCAVCRQITAAGDVSYVDTCPPEETDQEVVVKGSLSTKVDAVIHRLLLIRKNEPEAKALVFSTWPDVLKAIGRACDDNGIRYCDLMGSKFQENLSKFKESVEIQVLLMPLKSGANGLNLVEATHVLLVEPILNPGSELQAIGRVHRIGQTKPTQVHRFLVKSTIEEGLASLMQRHVTDASETLVAKENPVTLCELRDLFLDQTCMSTETATVEEMR